MISGRCPEFDVTAVKSGPLGGDQQIGTMIANGNIDALIFFTDPLAPHPHDVDVKALARLATVHDIPMACSPATASLIVASGFLGGGGVGFGRGIDIWRFAVPHLPKGAKSTFALISIDTWNVDFGTLLQLRGSGHPCH